MPVGDEGARNETLKDNFLIKHYIVYSKTVICNPWPRFPPIHDVSNCCLPSSSFWILNSSVNNDVKKPSEPAPAMT